MTTMTPPPPATMRRMMLGLIAALGIAAAGVTALPASDAAAGALTAGVRDRP